MNKVWKDQKLALKTKLRLFDSIMISVLLYGCETWKSFKDVELRVRRFESNCLRKKRIRWQQHVTEGEARRKSGQESVIEKIRRRRWMYFGPVLCMPDGRLPKECLNWTPEGSRRPKETYRRTMTKEMEAAGIIMNDALQLA